MFRAVIKFVFLFFADLVMTVVGRILAPVVVLFADEDGWLPDWLSWFQTPDNPLDGDDGHRERWPREGWFWRYCRRVAWLWRNNVYGFTIDVLGAKVYPWARLSYSGDLRTSNRPLHEGFVLRKARNLDDAYFQIYYVKRWWKFVLRVNIGWKLWTAFDAILSDAAIDAYEPIRCQYVFSINPFMGYEK